MPSPPLGYLLKTISAGEQAQEARRKIWGQFVIAAGTAPARAAGRRAIIAATSRIAPLAVDQRHH